MILMTVYVLNAIYLTGKEAIFNNSAFKMLI